METRVSLATVETKHSINPWLQNRKQENAIIMQPLMNLVMQSDAIRNIDFKISS